ncbi:MAG: NAD-dependent epimerase/dehydratase family protein [Candidatus Thorarchaeota archaeon]|nr:NAD-dependent epimerase/dehydratase family protein [Candidatus Thorarchaeota archaeon]
MLKILILGGTGLLGSYLVPKLLARGYNVSVLSRNPRILVYRYGDEDCHYLTSPIHVSVLRNSWYGL